MAANPVVTGMEVFSQPGGHSDEDLFGRVCVCAGMELHCGERQESQKGIWGEHLDQTFF